MRRIIIAYTFVGHFRKKKWLMQKQIPMQIILTSPEKYFDTQNLYC